MWSWFQMTNGNFSFELWKLLKMRFCAPKNTLPNDKWPFVILKPLSKWQMAICCLVFSECNSSCGNKILAEAQNNFGISSSDELLAFVNLLTFWNNDYNNNNNIKNWTCELVCCCFVIVLFFQSKCGNRHFPLIFDLFSTFCLIIRGLCGS